MKYSELISFKPIESTIQLVEGTKTPNCNNKLNTRRTFMQ